jgi:hypothetical protein
LNKIELLVCAIAASVETDLMCGRAIAHLQAPIGGSRPTVGLLAHALTEFGDVGTVISAILTGVAVESGLLQVLNDGAPLAERPVCIPAPLCLALGAEESAAEHAAWPGTSLGRSGNRNMPLPPSASTDARKRARGLASGTQGALVVRGGSPAEAKSGACEIT